MEIGGSGHKKWHTQQFKAFVRRYLRNYRDRSKTQRLLNQFFLAAAPPDSVYVPYDPAAMGLNPGGKLPSIRRINVLLHEGSTRNGEIHLKGHYLPLSFP
ncbi:MAG: hypothetical protein ABEK50_06180, partial [bacterium]